MSEEANEEEQMIINQQYKVWKKEAPDLYDSLILHSLQIPAHSFEWLPEVEAKDGVSVHYALLGLNSPEPQKSCVAKISVQLPNEGNGQQYVKGKQNKVKILSKMYQPAEINRARLCPKNSNLFAASLSNGQIALNSLMTDQVTFLSGHSNEGYGLCWNPISPEILASGQTDKKVCIWDIQKGKKQKSKILPTIEIAYHNASVEDVAWHKFHRNLLASCSDDRLMMLWDMRSGGEKEKRPLFQIVAHTNEVYSLDFSPFNEFLLLSGSADNTASVWDLRNLTRSLSTVNDQKGSVIKVQWSPFTSTIFGTCGYARNVSVWDLSSEVQDSEPLFRHGGHRSKVLDFDWNKNEKLMVGSTEESNCLHVWQMSRNTYYEEE